MSQGAGSSDHITVETGGVSVTKRFEPEEFAVPTIEFSIESTRDDPTTVRLVDRIPDEFPMDGVGFHPDYGSENWTAYKNHRVEFEAEIEANDSLVTVYGIRISDPADAEPFLTEPTLEVEAGREGDLEATDDSTAGQEALEGTAVSDLVDAERTDVVREFIKGDRESIPGLEVDDPESLSAAELEEAVGDEVSLPGEDPPDIDIDESELEGLDSDAADDTSDSGPDLDLNLDPPPTEQASTPEAEDTTPAAASQSSAGPDPTAPAGSTDSAGTETESLAAALAAELREGDIPDAVLEDIRTAIAPESSPRMRTQLDHLHGRVGELEAYTDAFGEFLDENGTGDQLVSALRQDVDDLAEELATLSSELERVHSRLDGTESDLAAQSDRIQSVTENFEQLDDQIETIVGEQTDIRNRLDADIERIEEQVSTQADEREAAIESLRTTVNELDETVSDIEEWRAQLGEMFSD